MSQKLVQFRGLCDKNIAAMDPNAEHDPFVPTSDDLQGFWDMVYIQVKKQDCMIFYFEYAYVEKTIFLD